jgi:hypothetical protein
MADGYLLTDGQMRDIRWAVRYLKRMIAGGAFERPRQQQQRTRQVVLSQDLPAAVNTKRDPSTATARVLRRKANGDLTLLSETITVVNRFTQISVDAGTYAKAEWIDGEWQLYAADCPGGSLSESL